MLLFTKQEEGAARLSEVRNALEESLNSLNFASKLWGIFKALIAGALNEVVNLSQNDRANVMDKIEQTVIDFLRKSCEWIVLPYGKRR